MSFAAGQRILASMLSGVPQLISLTVPGSNVASVSITVPSGYKNLRLIGRTLSDNASTVNLQIQFNGDTGSNYVGQSTRSSSTTVTGLGGGAATSIYAGASGAANNTANYWTFVDMTFVDYASSVFKGVVGVNHSPLTVSVEDLTNFGGQWLSTSAITSIQLFFSGGNVVANSQFSLYGMP